MTDHAARWEERFSRPGFMFGDAPNAFLRSQAHLFAPVAAIPGARVLVPGDGEGRNGVWLAEQGLDVLSLDLAEAGMRKARALAAERGVQIEARQADLTRWAWPDAAFDAVVSVFVHLPPAERQVVHAGMWRALRPGGLLVMEAFRPEQAAVQRRSPDGRGSGGPPDPALLFSAAVLRGDFPGAEWLLLEETETILAEGTHHVGPAAVTRGVARRPHQPAAELVPS